MQRKRVTSAQLALIARKQSQVAQKRTVIVDSAESSPNYVNGGKRAGKRKRGNSVTKRAPKTQAHAITYDVRNEYGELITSVRTLTYKRES